MSSTPITKEVMSEFYQRVYPTDLIARWLQYGEAAAYMGRREFCFTLVGDIFTRFRSYPTEAALKAELVRSGPEKIDIGAVYNVSPDKKQTVQLVPVARELVFDIDMSDYDALRSCCEGKKVCASCWTWMSTAAHVLRDLMTNDFGFRHIVPVFSGRRGIHLWILDPEARLLTDEERSAIVGYCTVIAEKSGLNILNNLRFNNLHPSLFRVLDTIIAPRFNQLFLTPTRNASDGTLIANPNCIFENPKAAKIIYDLLVSVEGSVANQRIVGTRLTFEEGSTFPEATWRELVAQSPPQVMAALKFAAMYPRLDEKVTTRRDHLLKLPFCIHPGTGRLCVPLEWHEVDGFDPQAHPPSLDYLLHEAGAIPPKWTKPLTDVLDVLEAEDAALRMKIEQQTAHLKRELIKAEAAHDD